MKIEHKTNAEDKPRQEDTKFGGCQGKTKKWGKPFDQIFLLLFNSSEERVQKSNSLAQYTVKSTLKNSTVKLQP